jgi:predicted nucleic acid-binding Zn ribbon protein
VTERGGKRGQPGKIGDALTSFLSRSGLAERVEQARVVPEWESLVGSEIARVTSPQSITRDGVLFVAVISHPWMSELSLMEPQIIAALNRTPDRAPVRRIHWVLRRD